MPDLGRKLKLVTTVNFYGAKIFNDKLCLPERVNKKIVYRLWLHARRKFKAVTLESLIRFAPYMEEKLRIFDKHVDAEGRTTLNMDEYMEYRKAMAIKAGKKFKKNAAKVGKKGKL